MFPDVLFSGTPLMFMGMPVTGVASTQQLGAVNHCTGRKGWEKLP
ncbi:hypothetical protein HNQ96_004133 [Aminobacter lissarensis]|uniref:Uncharacterized protein n=1 Tax=Aminobacter carboxidus TaxID=376165 RepID=A0A8E2BED9_9HYPH|nr:hypothetical protein [Aminobacter lissarensis]MBB6468249.1 hypothetical protein [Aminobacter lissarensis]